jgi:hypothetical protein
MPDIAEFIAMQLGNFEAVAENLAGATCIPGREPDFRSAGGPAAATYWQLVTPQSVLADIAAKRELLEVAREMELQDGWGFHHFADRIHCALAAPYAGRPGYRTEWGTDG